MEKPVVSIVVPMYNAEKTISKCLSSIPDRPDVQVVIVDDASADGCSHEAVRFMESRPSQPVSVVRLPVNVGWGAARNRVATLLEGEYVHQLDSDDWLHTDRYSGLVDTLPGSSDDVVYFYLERNDGGTFKPMPDTKMYVCACTCKFVRNSMAGGLRFLEEKVKGVDYFWNKELQSIPHADRFTDVVAYHYNFPREGSICWNASHGKGYNEP